MLLHSACRVLGARYLRMQLVEAGERGIEVCLVEDLDAVGGSTLTVRSAISGRFGLKTFSRDRTCRLSERALRGRSNDAQPRGGF